MDDHLHDIDKLFKTALKDHLDMPSANVWEKVEKNLQKRNFTSQIKKYKRWKWVAAALFIFSVGLAVYTFHLSREYKKAVREIKPKAGSVSTGSGAMQAAGRATSLKTNNSTPGKANENSVGDKKTSVSTNTTDNNLISKKEESQIAIENKEDKHEEKNKGQIIPSPVPATYLGSNKEIKNKRKSVINSTVSNRVVEVSARKKSENGKEAAVNSSDKSLDKKKSTTVNNVKKMIDKNEKEFSASPSLSHSKNNTNLNIKKTEVVPVEKENPVDETVPVKTNTSFPAKALSSKNNYLTVTPERGISIEPGPVNVPSRFLNIRLFLIPLSFKTHQPVVGDIVSTRNKQRQKAQPAAKNTVGAFYSSNTVTTKLTANNPDFKEDNYLHIKNVEKNRTSNTIGLSFEKNIIENFGVQTGVSITTYVTDLGPKNLVARRDNTGTINYRISTSSGYAYYQVKNRPQPPLADSIRTISSTTTVKYLSIPIGIHYQINAGRLSFSPSAIILANFKRSGTITTKQSLERTYSGKLEGLKSTYADGILQLRTSYFFTEKIGITLIPSIRHALSASTESRPVITRRNATGLAAGLHFRF